MYNASYKLCKFFLDQVASEYYSQYFLTVGSIGVELGYINLSDLKVDIVMLEN